MLIQELGAGVIENLIAAVPQLVTILSMLAYFISKTKTAVDAFPAKVDNYQKKVTDAFDGLQSQLMSFVKSSTDAFRQEVRQLKDDIHAEVGAELEKMKGELSVYQTTLSNMAFQNNQMVKENKLFADMIMAFVSQDPKMIRSGIAEIICAKTKLTKEELERYPELLIQDIKVLGAAMKETLVTLGKEEFEKLLRSIGYVRETENPEL